MPSKKEIPEELAAKLFVFVCRSRESEELELIRGDAATLLSMRYEKHNVRIEIKAYSSMTTKGESHITVAVNGEIVLEAKGAYVGRPIGLTVTTYIPGLWQRDFKKK